MQKFLHKLEPKTVTGQMPLWYCFWSYFVLFAGAVCLGIVSLYFATGSFHWSMFASYFQYPLLILLNLLPPVLFAAFFYFLSGRVGLSFSLTAVVVLVPTWINYFKLMFRNDPLLAEDAKLVTESVSMIGPYSLSFDWKMWLTLSLVVLGAVFCLFFARKRLRRALPRILGALAVIILSALLLFQVYLDKDVYESVQNYELINCWSGTETYLSHGFIWPLLYSVNSAMITPPEGYSPAEAESVLAEYEDTAPDGEKKVNVIAVMLEAYSDFSQIEGIDFYEDVYGPFHELEAESLSGNLLVNVFAGNTVNTERSFLTGYTVLGSFRQPSYSYLRWFQQQGYLVEGSHPGHDWFYNRLNINQNLGFDHYYFWEDYYQSITVGEKTDDTTFFSSVLDLYHQGISSSQPYFAFHVSYQNHGPYDTEQLLYDREVAGKSGLSQEAGIALNNYLGGIYDTTRQLDAFVDQLRTEEEPVILVAFGDHKPWLGDGNSYYEELGINLDLGTEEGFYNYYGTRYLIWANDAAKEVLGNDFCGEGPDIGPYFLMNVLFAAAGWTGDAYMQFADTVRQSLPVINTSGIYLTQHGLTECLTEEEQALLSLFQSVEYDQRTTRWEESR